MVGPVEASARSRLTAGLAALLLIPAGLNSGPALSHWRSGVGVIQDVEGLELGGPQQPVLLTVSREAARRHAIELSLERMPDTFLSVDARTEDWPLVPPTRSNRAALKRALQKEPGSHLAPVLRDHLAVAAARYFDKTEALSLRRRNCIDTGKECDLLEVGFRHAASTATLRRLAEQSGEPPPASGAGSLRGRLLLAGRPLASTPIGPMSKRCRDSPPRARDARWWASYGAHPRGAWSVELVEVCLTAGRRPTMPGASRSAA